MRLSTPSPLNKIGRNEVTRLGVDFILQILQLQDHIFTKYRFTPSNFRSSNSGGLTHSLVDPARGHSAIVGINVTAKSLVRGHRDFVFGKLTIYFYFRDSFLNKIIT